MKTNEEGLLQIKLAGLQIDMQDIASQFQTYVTILYSVMIGVVLFVYTLAITLASLQFVFVGIIAIFVFPLASLGIHVWYSREVNAIRNEIDKLEKQYEL